MTFLVKIQLFKNITEHTKVKQKDEEEKRSSSWRIKRRRVGGEPRF